MDLMNSPMDSPTQIKDPQTSAVESPDSTKLAKDFRARVEACKNYRKKLIPNWTTSIDYRRGKPFTSQTDEDRVVVNLDWSMTKAKQATLFSQVPRVHIDHPPESISSPFLPKFESKLNDTLNSSGIESAMDEILVDVINAAGIGTVLISYDVITEDVEIPISDPTLGLTPPDPALNPALNPTPDLGPDLGGEGDASAARSFTIKRPVDQRYTVNRISPADLLWPITFTRSDFEKGPWIGRSGRITWATAVQWLGLTEQDKETIMGEERSTLDRLTHDIDKDKTLSDEMVGFDEVFYRECEYNPAAKSYALIHHLVFVHGKDDPVIDEMWKGQRVGPDGSILGSLKFPIQTLTLSYITDECIPPSDSAIGRPQINEINKLRTLEILQRQRSLPVRWFDVNRVDTTIQQSLMRGTWQAMIPVQGDGTRFIGEVQRSSMPPENGAFVRNVKMDLAEQWSVGPNQEGSGADISTATEASVVQTNFQTKIARERAKVSKFVCAIAEVLGGLLSLNEPAGSFGQGFDPAISKALVYSILADSTVLLDSNQKLKKLLDFVNFTAKSGFINLEPVLREIAVLSGLDPNAVIQPPSPKPPAEPTISLRLTGVEDLMNPLVLAFLMNSGQAPSPDLIEAAKKLIETAVTPPPMGGMMPPGGGAPPAGMPPGMPPEMPNMPPGVPPQGQGSLIQSGGLLPPPPPPPAVGAAHPDFHLLEKVNKRSEER